jgi:hypothetical protein
MKRRKLLFFPLASWSSAFLVLGICSAAPSQGKLGQDTPKAASQVQPAPQPVAIGKQWIARDKQTIEVSRGNQSVSLDYFTELVVATMTDDKTQPEKLIGKTISLERDPKQRDQWSLFVGGGGISLTGRDSMILPGNVFRIQRVVPSTVKNQVKVQVDGHVYRLRPGEVLFVLG